MVFSKPLRDGVKRGRIRSSIRIWANARVKVGGRYRLDDGHIVIDAIDPIRYRDITTSLAQESGFPTVRALLKIARHGTGDQPYLVRFHYVPPGGWDQERQGQRAHAASDEFSEMGLPRKRTPPRRAAGGLMPKKPDTTHPNAVAFPAGLSGPALRALATAGIRSMAMLTKWREADLAALHGMGPKGVAMLKAALGAQGRRLRG